jgi:hypothetical protein
MRFAKVPLTRQNYLDFMFLGEVPKELGPEEEADIPKRFQRGPER